MMGLEWEIKPADSTQTQDQPILMAQTTQILKH